MEHDDTQTQKSTVSKRVIRAKTKLKRITKIRKKHTDDDTSTNLTDMPQSTAQIMVQQRQEWARVSNALSKKRHKQHNLRANAESNNDSNVFEHDNDDHAVDVKHAMRRH